MRRDTKLDKIKTKLLKQYEVVSRKFKVKISKEVTNQDIQVALYQYSTSEPTNKYEEKNIEWIHDRIINLNEEQMAVVTKRFWEAKSFVIIANELGHLGDHKWASRKLEEAFDVLRKKV